MLDPADDAPALANADGVISANYHDAQGIRDLAAQVDVITVELEDVGVDALAEVRDAGTPVYPAPELIALIRDKLTQKQAYQRLGFPTAEFVEVDPSNPQAFADFGYPLVQKTRTGGYDGRGVCVMNSPSDYPSRLEAPSFVERKIDAAMELGIMVARSPSGDVRALSQSRWCWTQHLICWIYCWHQPESLSRCGNEPKRWRAI